jgi:hypothetical protein
VELGTTATGVQNTSTHLVSGKATQVELSVVPLPEASKVPPALGRLLQSESVNETATATPNAGSCNIVGAWLK